MFRIEEITNYAEIYKYQMRMTFPYRFSVDFDTWKKSFTDDIDGEGRPLFEDLHGKAAYRDGKLVGFVQYGKTAFGFAESGEISKDVTYPVIRSLYFDEGCEEAGSALLNEAMNALGFSGRVYAFFHYFGMSCFARHGKLFEKYTWIEAALKKYGFIVEHENVYYSLCLRDVKNSEMELIAHELTKGNQQAIDFVLDNTCIGGCEVHYLEAKGIAYLRWIFIEDHLQNQGFGSKCMEELKFWLYQKGFSRLDTDTAIGNLRAQHYYAKNDFIRKGITRSYYIDFNPTQAPDAFGAEPANL